MPLDIGTGFAQYKVPVVYAFHTRFKNAGVP